MNPPPLLESIYREIGGELAQVEDRMRRVLASERPAIREMIEHASRFGGKRLRPALVILTARCAGGLTPRHRELAAVVELVHLATLVHDDIIDEADVRRRGPTINARWSNYEAVLLGDIIFARAINLLSQMGDRRSLLVLTRAVSTLCEGEILQNRHRRDPALSASAYYEIIEAKTGALFGAGCELAATLSEADGVVVEAFAAFGLELGLAFQIIDDCLDLAGDEGEVGKSLGSDLRGGKMTLPLILLRERLDDVERVCFDQVISGADDRPARAAEIRALLRGHGTIDEAMGQAREHLDAALAAVRGVLPPDRVAPLEAVAAFVVGRRA